MTIVSRKISEPGLNDDATQFKQPVEDKYLQSFASSCRIYYRSSLASSQNQMSTCTRSSEASTEIAFGDVSCSKNLTLDRNSVESAKVVLAAFDAYCAGEEISIDAKFQHAVVSAGLIHLSAMNNADPEVMMEYMKIRDRERKEAHRIQMIERQIEFCETLSSILSQASGKDYNNGLYLTKQDEIQDTLASIRHFVNKRKGNVGSHPILAGIVAIFEYQLKQNNICMQWTIDSSTFTENCFGSSDCYTEDCLVLLRKIFIIKTDNLMSGIGGKLSGDQVDGSSILLLSLKPGISNNTISRLIRSLPSQQELDARPTGTIQKSSIPRINAGGLKDEKMSIMDWLIDTCASCAIS